MGQVSTNIKYLRKKMGYTQERMAQVLDIKRSLLGAYEEGRADPRLTNLAKMAEVFQCSLDDLILGDATEFSQQAKTNEGQATDNNLKVLTISVDQQNEEYIDLVQQKASAGYLNGFSDPEYVESLPKFKLPVFRNGTFRAFEIKGDSMLPLQSGSIVIGKYVESLDHISNGEKYVLLTKREGVVFKTVHYDSQQDMLELISENRQYDAYRVEANEVLEVWRAVGFLAFDFPSGEITQSYMKEMSMSQLTSIVLDLQKQVINLQNERNSPVAS